MGELLKEITSNLTNFSRKRLHEEVTSIENMWYDLGDRISERENEIKVLLRSINDTLELISDCDAKLNSLEAELNSIDVISARDCLGFECTRKRLYVSSILFYLVHRDH